MEFYFTYELNEKDEASRKKGELLCISAFVKKAMYSQSIIKLT